MRTSQRRLTMAVMAIAMSELCGSGLLHSQEATPPVPVTASAARLDAAVLSRQVTLHLAHVRLGSALAALAAQAHVQIIYSRAAVPVDNVVSLQMDRATVRDVLRVLLASTDLDVMVSQAGDITIGPRPASATTSGIDHQQGTATISGYVRDSATGASIPQVMVRVDGTGLEVKSGSDGQYKITGVAAGEYRVTARRVGYVARTRTITLTDGQAAKLNFLLNPPATRLDEVVTTAAGSLRRYQVGNVISTINVDSIAPTVPAASVTDIISGRAPGVEVVETGGAVGSGEAIRIRGQSSMALQSDPIVIVDGVRQDNSAGSVDYASGNTLYHGPSPSRLDDLDFSQIATIDILKGPAATTEYGTDGANGVIIITTKAGTSGAPQWHVGAEQSASAIPIGFPEYYSSWGHATTGAATPEVCPLSAQYSSLAKSLAGGCIVDSITHFNPLNESAYSVFGTAPWQNYDLDVGGGSEGLRYYVAGNLRNEMGDAHLPSVFDQEADALGFPASSRDPNSENQENLRGNMTVRLGSTADFQMNVAYLSTYEKGSSNGGAAFLPEPPSGTVSPDSANNYGYGPNTGSFAAVPLNSLGSGSTQQTDRFTGGMTLNWRPTAWLVTRSIVGIDHGSQQSSYFTLPQTAYYDGDGVAGGVIELANGSNDQYTVDLRGTATASLTRTIRSATSLGLQLDDDRESGLAVEADDISEANFTFTGAPSYSTPTQTQDYAVTAGGYIEENLSYADRLFVTGSLRLDAGSGFGGHYNDITYPGVQVSWLAVNTAQTSVRFRGALGESGQQPPYGAALQGYQLVTTQGSGTALNPITGYRLTYAGNLGLTPERTSEYEGGLDLGLLGTRLTLDVTGYSKTTYNTLYSQTLGWDVSDLPYEENLGEVRNTGVEATLTAVVVQSALMDWTVTLNTSVNNNKLVSLDPGALPQSISAGSETQYVAPGYPLYGYWGLRTSYTDANRDGILETDELTQDTVNSYLGSSLPKYETSVQTHFGFWREAVTVGALFDYRADFLVFMDNYYAVQGNASTSFESQNVATSPLWMQAVTNSFFSAGGWGSGYPSGWFEHGDYIRFRELSLTYNLPRRWAHAAHVSRLSLTGAVRNLALWTKLEGADPETSDQGAEELEPGAGRNETYVNNDIREIGNGAIPLTRNWDLRLNVGF